VHERSISVPRQGRYALLGDPDAGSAETWFVLHGYGELAPDFLGRFAALAGPSRLLVAPEALSRFYLGRGTGTVGASWMTRVAREEEIADYVRYLDAVYGAVLGTLDPRSHVHVLGFSQGGATAFRWAALGNARVDGLTLWGAGVPEDVDLAARGRALARIELVLVLGRSDETLGAEEPARSVERLGRASLVARVVRFDGGHELDAATLEALAARPV
jgi:predicted esterase